MMDGRQLIVLIADDAPEDRAALRNVLSHDPAVRYAIIEAESGTRALELCRARSPDCLILDYDLPDLSGLESLKRLAAEDGLPACAVVMLIDAGDAQLAVEAMKSGAHDCLEKDRANGETLPRAVNYAIEKADQQRQIMARERGLIEKNRAIEADLAVLQREAAGRNQGEEAQQVARAGVSAGRVSVSRPQSVDQKRAEDRLRLVSAAIEQSSESVIITTAQLDPPGPQIVYVNPAFTKMTGYAPEDVIGKTPRILQAPKTDRSVLDRLRKDCRTGKVFHGEVINYRKDGSEYQLEWSVGPVRNERGEITHFVATQRDVTERRRIEEELRRREEEFRTLFELSATGMAQVGPDGRYLRVNRKLCQMLGYSEQELLKLTLHEVTHPDDREASAAKLSSSFTDGSDEYSLEKRYVRKDGAIIWALINWTVVRGAEGQPLRTVANIQDITARKHAEEALRASEAQMRAILDNSTAVIFVKDLEGRYLRINRWYEVLHGVTEAEVKGKTDYDIHAREIADALRANDQEVIAANAPLQFEEQVVTADGLRHFISAKFPLHDDSGRPYAVCSIATDITERKQAEEALQESEGRLRRITEATQDVLWEIDPRTGRLWWSERARPLFGFQAAEYEIDLEDWYDRIHPEDVDRVKAQFEQFLRNGSSDWIDEYRFRRADGAYIYILDRGRKFHIENGELALISGAMSDITERKQTEESLRQSEERFRSLIEQASEGIFVANLEGHYTDVNSSAGEMLGYTREELLGMRVSDLLPPEDLPRLEATRERLLSGEALVGEWRLRHKDEHYLHTELSTKILPDGRWYAIVRDITDRKRAEEALQLSEERLNVALEAVNIGMLDWDIRANVLVWSEKLIAMFGLLPDRTWGAYEDWVDRVHPEDMPACEASILETLKHRLSRWQAEYRIIRGDTGEARWIDTHCRIFYDDQGWPVRAIAANMDITDRKQVEEAVRESEARFRQIADAMPQIVYTCGPDGIANYINQRGQEYLGVSLEQSVGSAWREALHPDDRERTEQQWAEAVKTERPFEIEYRLRRKDGQYRWLLSRAVPIRNEQRKIIKWIGTSTDIHDRKQAEAEREEVLASEQAAREASEAANRAKDEFLALVSHELRSPLTAILGYASLLRQGPFDAQKVKQAVEVIERSGKAQVQLIDDLLDTARIISGKLKLYVGPVDLAVVIHEAVQTIYPAANAKGISLQADFPSEIGQITGDPVRLQQVVWNLLSNAVKFTPMGGRVEVRLERVDPNIRITVSDTGKGISPEFLPYVFDRFRQADASSARRYGGLGLGLALVKYLVELHGGTIEAASAGEGQGTTFIVTLPVRAVAALPGEAAGSPVAAPSPEEAAMLAGVRVLVVDDENEARELIKLALEQYGAEVVTAGSAAEAYNLITTAQERPEVIVTDLSMPDEDGYSLLRRVREWEQQRGRYVPAVALTAYGRIEDRVRALRAGFQTHVAKPVEPAELAVVIKSLIRHPD